MGFPDRILLSMSRNGLWKIDSRVIVYAAIGAALYGVLGLFSYSLPGAPNVIVRPAFALVPFFGYSFGPVVGFVVGLLGAAIDDAIGGSSAVAAWSWLATGLAGLTAGLAPLYVGGMMRGPIGRRALGGSIAAIVGTVVGFLLLFGPVLFAGAAFGTVLGNDYVPRVIADALASVILVPVLVYAWEPLQESMAR
jgi:energy-coupling factor transport system substrate-specific component